MYWIGISSPFNVPLIDSITDCSIFSIKLISLNPKSDLNLIVFESDNLDYIIIEIKISSWTYIEGLLPLNSLTPSILYFLICCFVRSFIYFTSYFPLISLSIRSSRFLTPDIFFASEMQSNLKSVLFTLSLSCILLQRLQRYFRFQR